MHFFFHELGWDGHLQQLAALAAFVLALGMLGWVCLKQCLQMFRFQPIHCWWNQFVWKRNQPFRGLNQYDCWWNPHFFWWNHVKSSVLLVKSPKPGYQVSSTNFCWLNSFKPPFPSFSIHFWWWPRLCFGPSQHVFFGRVPRSRRPSLGRARTHREPSVILRGKYIFSPQDTYDIHNKDVHRKIDKHTYIYIYSIYIYIELCWFMLVVEFILFYFVISSCLCMYRYLFVLFICVGIYLFTDIHAIFSSWLDFKDIQVTNPDWMYTYNII